MQARRNDIYRAKVSFRTSEDRRPWIALSDPVANPEVPGSTVILAAPLSSNLDLYDVALHFLLAAAEPDFGKTGLPRTSYIIAEAPAWVPLDRLEKRFGELCGDLLRRFEAWCGSNPIAPPSFP